MGIVSRVATQCCLYLHTLESYSSRYLMDMKFLIKEFTFTYIWVSVSI